MSTTITFDRESMARRYAHNHYDIDEAVSEIYHLPREARSNEIRFLEVNRLIPEMIDPRPIDFGMRRDGETFHTLAVLDVTPSQWVAIRRGEMSLPAGWSLDDCQLMPRDDDA